MTPWSGKVGLRAVVALDMTGPLGLQSQDAARALRVWADDGGLDLELWDSGGSGEAVSRMYASWTRFDADIVLLPYGSGAVRSALAGVAEGRLVWNHGGSDDALARRWAPMVLAPASTYFAPLIELAVRRSCRSVTVVRGRGGFAARVVEGAVRCARRLDLNVEVFAPSDRDVHRVDTAAALLVVGRFEDDVAIIASLEERPRLVGCVAAGIPAFGRELGAAADGVLGPAQWWPDTAAPELGPSGREFADRYRARFGEVPSYVAAQAAAAGWLAGAAAERSLTARQVSTWSASTLLGTFRVDPSGRQIGHSVTVVGWRQGRMELHSEGRR